MTPDDEVRRLLDALQDPSYPDRPQAAIDLGKLLGGQPDKQVDDAVYEILSKALLEDPDEVVRETSAWALGQIVDQRGIRPLLTVMQNEQETEKIRGLAAEGLGIIGGREAVQPLLAILQVHSATIRYDAAFALGDLGDLRAVPALLRLVASDDPLDHTVLFDPGDGPAETPANTAAESIDRILRGNKWHPLTWWYRLRCFSSQRGAQ